MIMLCIFINSIEDSLYQKTWWQDQWPASLKDFILKLRSMVFCQEQADINTVCNIYQVNLNPCEIRARSR